MKNWGRDILTALFFGVLIPAFMLRVGSAMLLLRQPATPEGSAPSQTVAESTVTPRETGVKSDLTMYLRTAEGILQPMNMDAYLVGAVLAEMPASFEQEALKAQAVAARTYALKACLTGGKHGDGSVCTNYACCQAYIREQDYMESGGSRENVDKIYTAVEATSGWVLTYEGDLIEATYFSCSGGRTEDAEAVWGSDYPYLQAVDSPGEEHAAHYTDTVSFPLEEFCACLGIAPQDNRVEIGQITYTDGMGVDTIELCGTSFRGTWLRTALGLRSTCFTITQDGNIVTIVTRGFGHRVGMSQYGADAMAVTGADYRSILAHYYPGTVLTYMEQEDIA